MARGGKRPGAGRPPGSPDKTPRALPHGAVGALKAIRHRVPEGTPEEVAELADEAFSRVVSVMRGEVSGFDAFPTLQAAKLVREEVCGPVPKKHEVTGADGGPVQVSINVSRKPEGE